MSENNETHQQRPAEARGWPSRRATFLYVMKMLAAAATVARLVRELWCR